MRILFVTLFRIGDTNQRKKLNGSCFSLFCCHVLFMCFQHFFDLFSDPHGRVQRSHRVLEYHGNFRTTNCLHFSLCIFGQVFSVVHNGSFGHFSILRKDSHDSFHSDGFTGTGLSNDCQSFLLVQIKVYVTDRLYDALCVLICIVRLLTSSIFPMFLPTFSSAGPVRLLSRRPGY